MKLQQSRYERKYVIEKRSRENVIAFVKNNPGLFSEIYFERRINNIYFDTHNLTFFLDNNFGRPNRKKVRIRWYGELFKLNLNPKLEYKLKTGNTGHKLTFKLKPLILNTEITQKTLLDVFESSDLPEWVFDDLHMLKPTLVNSYRRKYFLSACKQFRITIDSELEYYKITPYNNSFLQNYTFDDRIILELKYKIDSNLQPDYISNHFPFRMSKNSKYVSGIEQFYINIPV